MVLCQKLKNCECFLCKIPFLLNKAHSLSILCSRAIPADGLDYNYNVEKQGLERTASQEEEWRSNYE